MPAFVDVFSGDYGLPFNNNGRSIILKARNIDETGGNPITVKAGYLIDTNFNNNLSSVTDEYNLPFYMFGDRQGYSNTINSAYIPWENNSEWYLQNPFNSVTNLAMNLNNYRFNHSFKKTYDLRGFVATNDHATFEIAFLPKNFGYYSAQLQIWWCDNISSQIRPYTVFINAAAVGRVSEIDQTSYPEFVFEVDTVGSNNFFEIEA
jgi:hypothetical protein